VLAVSAKITRLFGNGADFLCPPPLIRAARFVMKAGKYMGKTQLLFLS
jgi:hypothetical protein